MTEQHTPDGNLAYLDSGAGRPLVLLHAFPLNKAMWQPQFDALASIARVIAPDMRGFGGSREFESKPSVEQMADDVASLLDALQIRETIVLGGLSMGGYVALAFARQHADRLRGLILADTKADPDDDTAKANRDKMIALVNKEGSRAVIETLLPKLISAGTIARRPTIVEEIRALASAQPAAIAGALQALRDRPDATPSLVNIAVPTLVIVGQDDELTPSAKATAMTQAIRKSQMVVLPGAGHLSNLEQPEQFNTAVRAFLERLN